MADGNPPIAEELNARYSLLEFSLKKLSSLNYKNPERLAATDVFIEKAQQRLTQRAVQFFVAGAALSAAAMALMLSGAYLVFTHSLANDLKDLGGLDGYRVTLLVLRGTTVAGFILGAAYVSFSFAKAFFHEGTNSLNRRHALRFGRLYVYLKDGNIVFKDLERAFNWNIENTTAFKDINTENITKTAAGRLIEQPVEVAKAIANRKPRPPKDA